MAKATGKGKTRQTIKVQAMRELMFGSGGRCAMTDCGLSLTSPSGGWIGTIAHIVGAEQDGPRGHSQMTPEERAAADNLMLMCATHGREVDATDTGEMNYPVDRLRLMKAEHETRVTDAVTAAIEQDRSGVPTATGAIDIALRPATAAVSAEGLLESLRLDTGTDLQKQCVADLARFRADLEQLSQLALDTLADLLALWVMSCQTSDPISYNFGDLSDHGPSLPLERVENRVRRQVTVDAGLAELQRTGLLELCPDEYTGTADYVLLGQWQESSRVRYSFWISIAWFLYEGYGVEIQHWVRGLDFSILDRVAPDSRRPGWRD